LALWPVASWVSSSALTSRSKNKSKAFGSV
jgi:hypothetical protein